MADNRRTTDASLRPWLAMLLIGLSVGGIVLAAAISILAQQDETERAATTRLVFTSVLPLFGTWVGTVLAFYFAKDNLQAATESTVRLSGRAERTTVVAGAMIPRAQMVVMEVSDDSEAQALKLAEIEQKMAGAGKSRMPIFLADGSVAYIVSRPTLLEYRTRAALDPAQPIDPKKTIADLLKVPELAKEIQAIAVVGPDDVLGTARARMAGVEGCWDVFVTQGGGRKGAVVGWLTNTDLAKVE